MPGVKWKCIGPAKPNSMVLLLVGALLGTVVGTVVSISSIASSFFLAIVGATDGTLLGS